VPGLSPDERRAEIAAGLERVRERIARAADAAGRDPADLHLVVVTKTFPADDVRHLAALGVRDVGENRDQEAAAKAAECGDLALAWHVIGRLQTNKAHSVVRYAAMVHSVDRARLARALGRAAHEAGRSLDVLVQVSLDGDPDRGGAVEGDLPVLADEIAATDGLRLRGLMAVPPVEADARAAYDRLVALAVAIRAVHPRADVVSGGMSGDLEAAVAAGATHLRVGAAILGSRPPLL